MRQSRNVTLVEALDIARDTIINSGLYHLISYYSDEEYIPGLNHYSISATFEPNHAAFDFYLEMDKNSIETKPHPLGKMIRRMFKYRDHGVRWSTTTRTTQEAVVVAAHNQEVALLANRIGQIFDHLFIYDHILKVDPPPKPTTLDIVAHELHELEEPRDSLRKMTNNKLRNICREHEIATGGNKDELVERIVSYSKSDGDRMVVWQYDNWRDNHMFESITAEEFKEDHDEQ